MQMRGDSCSEKVRRNRSCSEKLGSEGSCNGKRDNFCSRRLRREKNAVKSWGVADIAMRSVTNFAVNGCGVTDLAMRCVTNHAVAS